jgi:S1-C subfamily serine protease
VIGRQVAIAAGALAVLLGACAPDPPGAAVGIRASGCPGGRGVGSGAYIAEGLVLTAAHTVAGAHDIAVVRAGQSVPAEVVAFDPDMDLAVLSTEHPGTSHFRYAATQIARGTPATAYVWRDERVVAIAVTMVRPVQIATADIYREGETLRAGYELAGDIHPGDSGGPVLVDGRLAGIVWARSNRASGRGYAIDPVAAGETIRRQLAGGAPDPGDDLARCAG